MHCLSLQSVKKSFKQGTVTFIVLNDISYVFEQGKTYAITGASGVGKSTLMHIVSGLDVPTAGSVHINGADIYQLSTSKKDILLNKELGLVFQQPYLIKELSVLENIMLKGSILGANSLELMEHARTLAGQVGLADKIDAMPASLSGGQQQRVAIARALFNKPAFLLADEPTGNLDDKTGKQIMDLLFYYQHTYSMGLIISSHDNYVISQMQVILELKNGKLHER